MRTQDASDGLFIEDVRRGTLIDGKRVTGLFPGQRNGRRTLTVRLDDGTRRGERRTYYTGTGSRLAGTRRLTTFAMPAGPVGRTPGGKLHGGWFGDRDDNGRGARTDRHSRMIDALTYA